MFKIGDGISAWRGVYETHLLQCLRMRGILCNNWSPFFFVVVLEPQRRPWSDRDSWGARAHRGKLLRLEIYFLFLRMLSLSWIFPVWPHGQSSSVHVLTQQRCQCPLYEQQRNTHNLTCWPEDKETVDWWQVVWLQACGSTFHTVVSLYWQEVEQSSTKNLPLFTAPV